VLEYEKICSDILSISDKIRYVGIYDAGEFYHKLKKNTSNYLTNKETELSLSQAVYRWSTRKKMASKVGKPIFSMAKYEKMYRFTLPLNGAGLILVSLEPEGNPLEIIEKVLELKEKFSRK
jgi:hypothetical protein